MQCDDTREPIAITGIGCRFPGSANSPTDFWRLLLEGFDASRDVPEERWNSDVETAQGMLAWPHSGFHVHDGVWVATADREFAVRLARYCARNPVALNRLEYQ